MAREPRTKACGCLPGSFCDAGSRSLRKLGDGTETGKASTRRNLDKLPTLNDEPARHVFAVNLQPPQRQAVNGTADLEGNPARSAVVACEENPDRERVLARTNVAQIRFVGVIGFHAV